jgi:hypothetical protein
MVRATFNSSTFNSSGGSSGNDFESRGFFGFEQNFPVRRGKINKVCRYKQYAQGWIAMSSAEQSF